MNHCRDIQDIFKHHASLCTLGLFGLTSSSTAFVDAPVSHQSGSTRFSSSNSSYYYMLYSPHLKMVFEMVSFGSQTPVTSSNHVPQFRRKLEYTSYTAHEIPMDSQQCLLMNHTIHNFAASATSSKRTSR
jgi:hypothetical protein